MFTREYMKKRREESLGKVDPAKLNWDVIKKERGPTVLWALEESYSHPQKKDEDKEARI
ncbi:MAG: hypothetical protein V1649_03380 [Patescibacteria group bacterium]